MRSCLISASSSSSRFIEAAEPARLLSQASTPVPANSELDHIVEKDCVAIEVHDGSWTNDLIRERVISRNSFRPMGCRLATLGRYNDCLCLSRSDELQRHGFLAIGLDELNQLLLAIEQVSVEAEQNVVNLSNT